MISMRKSKLGLMAEALLCSGCSVAGSLVGTAPADLTKPKQIDVVFNYNAISRYRSPSKATSAMVTRLIEAIDAANEEVLVAVQELSLPSTAQELIATNKRGDRIAVIL